MNRLTEKVNHYCDTDIDNEYKFADEDVSIGTIVDKLGKLEDLEEQLGCPLEVVLGFLTHSITEIIIEYDHFSGNYASPYCTDEDIVKAYVSSIYDRNEIDGISKPEFVVETNMGTFPLSDYKEHWWLKEDKSE